MNFTQIAFQQKLKRWLATFYLYRPKSVYFFTFHKCASLFFGHHIASSLVGLEKVDYGGKIYLENPTDLAIDFKKKGKFYGPIRLSHAVTSDFHQKVLSKILSMGFLQDKKCICLIRDPRDILISAYYSFGKTHNYSPVPSIRARQEETRNTILKLSVDEFVLLNAGWMRDSFQQLAYIQEECDQILLLKYEDMIHDWGTFLAQISQFIEIDYRVIAQFYEQTRPNSQEQLNDHKRSGSTRQYQHKLQAQTIVELNRKLQPELVKYEYVLDK